MGPVSPAWVKERLASSARDLGVAIPASCYELLAQYTSLVLEWGSRFNLTGARTPAAFTDDHLADALVMLRHLPATPFRFVDVGSGSGLPGIPIALLRRDASGVLLEPVGKKHTFLAHAIRDLALSERLEARRERLEQHLAEGGRGAYDVAISRAVWPVSEWLALGAPLLRPGGVLLGVEGATPGELPEGAIRHPYRLQGRPRAVICKPA